MRVGVYQNLKSTIYPIIIPVSVLINTLLQMQDVKYSAQTRSLYVHYFSIIFQSYFYIEFSVVMCSTADILAFVIVVRYSVRVY